MEAMFCLLLSEESPIEVPLPKAPLTRALAQVQVPLVAALTNDETALPLIAQLQTRLGDVYPVLQREQEIGFVLGPQGGLPVPNVSSWRFRTLDAGWEVAVHPSFVALSTESYHSRMDFLDRLGALVEATHDVLGVRAFERLGVRYINQITDKFGDVKVLLVPEVVTTMATGLDGFTVEVDVRDVVLDIGGEKLHVRHGNIPAGAAILLGVAPYPDASWVLDLDAYSEGTRSFDVATIVSTAGRFADRCYRVFRGTVTDEFLRVAGGDP